jgi:hypothetical protein
MVARSGRRGDAVGGGVGQIEELKAKADEAKQSVDALAAPIDVKVDSSSVGELVAQLARASSLLASLNSGVARATHGLAPLGKTGSGHFGLSGIQGS